MEKTAAKTGRGGQETVTTQVAWYCFPSTVIDAATTAVPDATAVTVPVEETVATEVSEEPQTTVEPAGCTVAVRVPVPPVLKLRTVLSRTTDGCRTDTRHSSDAVAPSMDTSALTTATSPPTAVFRTVISPVDASTEMSVSPLTLVHDTEAAEGSFENAGV